MLPWTLLLAITMMRGVEPKPIGRITGVLNKTAATGPLLPFIKKRLDLSDRIKRAVNKESSPLLVRLNEELVGRWKPVGLEIVTVVNEKRFAAKQPTSAESHATVEQVRTAQRLPWIGWVNGKRYFMFSKFGRDLRLYFLDVRGDEIHLRGGLAPSAVHNYAGDSRLFKLDTDQATGMTRLKHVNSEKYVGMEIFGGVSRTTLVEARNAFDIRLDHVQLHRR